MAVSEGGGGTFAKPSRHPSVVVQRSQTFLSLPLSLFFSLAANQS